MKSKSKDSSNYNQNLIRAIETNILVVQFSFFL
jgi:hypothetical protein